MRKIKSKGYWTLDRCKEDAKKYETKQAWRDGNSSAISIAKRNGWMGLCCGHMTRLRLPPFTLEECQKSALQSKTRTEWFKKNQSAYSAARNKGWLDECCRHMTSPIKPSGYWTREKCLESARKYKTRSEWRNSDRPAYNQARYNGSFDECLSHMPKSKRRAFGYWTKLRCMESASKHGTRKGWVAAEESGYKAAVAAGWFDECTAHMTRLKKPKGYWTLWLCKESALQHKTIKSWEHSDNGAVQAARINGWFDECSSHMERLQLPSGHWSLEACIEDAKKYATRLEWVYAKGSAYTKAQKRGWLDKCCEQMEYRGPSDVYDDRHIKHLIARGTRIKRDEIPPELVELKREQIKLHRLIKEVTQ